MVEKRLGTNLGIQFASGLDAIFKVKNNLVGHLNISDIKAAKWQPRQHFDDKELDELADSIKIHGVLSPILVRKNQEEGYLIVAGERRYRASILAGKDTIPAIIMNVDEQNSLEVSIIENLQRKDLNPIEKAKAFEFLIEKFELTHDILGERLGVSRSVITNYLRLNTLDLSIQDKIASGKLSFTHGRILAGKNNAKVQADKVENNNISSNTLAQNYKKEAGKKANDDMLKLQDVIYTSSGYNSLIEFDKNNKGSIVLYFDDLNQLEDIVSKLCFSTIR